MFVLRRPEVPEVTSSGECSDNIEPDSKSFRIARDTNVLHFQRCSLQVRRCERACTVDRVDTALNSPVSSSMRTRREPSRLGSRHKTSRKPTMEPSGGMNAWSPAAKYQSP